MDVFKKLTILIKSNLVKFFNVCVCVCGYLSGFIKMSNQILFNSPIPKQFQSKPKFCTSYEIAYSGTDFEICEQNTK